MPDSSLLDAKKWCERTLSTAFPSTPIGFENFNFKPNDGLYLICQFTTPTAPQNPTLAAGYARENPVFQVFVMAELNKGSAVGLGTALQVRESFKMGTSFTEGQTLGHILKTPQISSPVQISNRYCYPVLIPLTLQVTTGV